MLFLCLPPTCDRYVAEIRNLLNLRCRPLCVVGRPRATTSELRKALGGEKLGKRSFCVRNCIITLTSSCTVLAEQAAVPCHNAYISSAASQAIFEPKCTASSTPHPS